MSTRPDRLPGPGRGRPGFTLVEVMVVVAMIGILSTIAALSFPRAVEQSRADLAAANLRNIQVAQRLYRLYESASYATTLDQLKAVDLLGDEVLSPDAPPADLAAYDPSYVYWIDGDNPLVIHARRTSPAVDPAHDELVLDARGYVGGEIRFTGFGAGLPPIRPARIFSHQDP